MEIRYYSIIYGLIDEVKGALEGMLEPERKETFIGYAEVLEIFDISKLDISRMYRFLDKFDGILCNDSDFSE